MYDLSNRQTYVMFRQWFSRWEDVVQQFVFEAASSTPSSSRTKLGNQASLKMLNGQLLHAFSALLRTRVLVNGCREFKLRRFQCAQTLTNCEPSRELQESLGPSGPEIPKKSEKSLPGPPALAPQKVWKKSRKSPEQTYSRLFPDFSDFFETFSKLFGAPGLGGPGRLFSDFFGISGPEGSRDSCSSREGSQLTKHDFVFCICKDIHGNKTHA